MGSRRVILLFAIVLLLTGCERVAPVERANRDQILLKGNGAEPADLDPHIITGVTESRIVNALLEGLMRPNPKNLTPEPGMAERYVVSADGKTYTFYIREDAVWSNGDPVTAYDFVFSYERLLSPDFGGEYAYMLFAMENAEAFNQGDIKNFTQVGVQALDSKTLEIRLNVAMPYFLSLILHHSWFPVHPPTILQHGKMLERGTRWTRAGNFVGNGPFNLTRWKVHDVIEVEKSDTYYDKESILLNAIHFYPIDNDRTEERAFRAGQIHITETIPTHKIAVYEQSEPEKLFIAPYLGTYYYLFNTQVKPLDDYRVRKALSLAIDRAKLVEHVLKRSRIAAYHFTPPDTAGYTSKARIVESVEKAQQLLAEAGFPGGEGFPKLELLYNTSESHKILAEAIQQMWFDNLGVQIALINQDWKVYLVSRRKRDYQIARGGWIGDYNDPSTFLELLLSTSGNNHTGWAHNDFDAWVKQAALTEEHEVRKALFQKAEALLLEQAPVMPIYFYKTNYLLHPAVQGWYPNVLDNHPYHGVWLRTDL